MSDENRRRCASTYIAGLKACLDTLALDEIMLFLKYLEQVYREGRAIFLIGNGGSAATASHIACDLGKTSEHLIRVMALTDCTPWVTALANDIGYQYVFAAQLKTWLHPRDLVIAITCSGNSPNIIEAIKVAKAGGAFVVGILGDGGQVKSMVDACVSVPRVDIGYVEDVHLMLGHLATRYFKSFVDVTTEAR